MTDETHSSHTSTAQAAVSGDAALTRFAPEPAGILVKLEFAAWQAMADADLLELFDLGAAVVAAQHGLPALLRPSKFGEAPVRSIDGADWRKIDGLKETDRTALEFSEQMSFDVASLQADQRKALFSQLGAAALPFTQAIYIADMLPRARYALDTMFGSSRAVREAPPAEGDLGHLVNELIRVVPALQAIDPVTTELVRLLGARRHQCRVCLSVRSHSAMVAGADDAMFDSVEAYATSAFSTAQKAALAFAEAMIASPATLQGEPVTQLATCFEPAARIELVLDIVRNATNKVAVALGGDAPRVETGYEVYDVRPDGEIIYGLDAP
ncbi:MAG: hypothetical protein VX246_12170 [Myxococcota bacterium]|nr:hypothetical protein [Myxococcota bacterium]